MKRYFNIYMDGIDGYDEWIEYLVADGIVSEKEMFEDVRQGLRELGGGHADIYDDATEELYAEIEV